MFTCAILFIHLSFGNTYISYTYFRRNKALDNFASAVGILKKISNSTLASCIRSCASNSFCLRLSFHTDRGCLLYKEEFETNGDNMNDEFIILLSLRIGEFGQLSRYLCSSDSDSDQNDTFTYVIKVKIAPPDANIICSNRSICKTIVDDL